MSEPPLWAGVREGCGTCEFAGPPSEHKQHECRRFPPTIVTEMHKDPWGNLQPTPMRRRPWLNESDWCGEYKRKIA